MSDGGAMAALIDGLCAADASGRAKAAAAIFSRGREMARSATQKWFVDPALGELVVRGPSGDPETTVGVAVQPDKFERLRSANGSPRLAEAPADQDVVEFELEFAGDARLDVLTTSQPEGPGAIARYLQRFGEGIQQVEISVTDVDRATEIVRARCGLEPIYSATRAGSDGTRINFFLAPTEQGAKVLIELVESRPQSNQHPRG